MSKRSCMPWGGLICRLLALHSLMSNLLPSQAVEAASTPAIPYDYLYPGNDLGAVYSPQGTTLKLWAPTARAVRVDLFNDAGSPACSTVPMQKHDDGIWSVTLNGDCDGKYYLYDITRAGVKEGTWVSVKVNDPYARGASANSARTLIYDPAKTNPDGWDQDQFVELKNNVDAIIYEVHVRDFTIDPGSGVSPAKRGKYLGMVEEGTRTPEGEKSGFDHLEELGITHVQILPVQDFAGGDERQKAGEYTWYNWGYDPLLFNTPEGSYASDADGTARQKELKQMILAFHRRHIGVILDVVYNHTASTGMGRYSIFDKIVPAYYYRTLPDGRYANGTRCGNEFASERPMARKVVLDSIRYWMSEYHVDGFRFDLMGIVDRDTMLAIYHEARKINPCAIIYGEGWRMEELLPPDRMMTQTNVQGTGIAAFNDGIRDNIKGNAARSAAAGFVQGAGALYGGMARFMENIKGQSTGKDATGIAVASPNETINYASVHDDNCLWDKLELSAGVEPEALRVNMDKLAAGIVLTAQGVPFLHGGDEFLRTKGMVHNSYNDNRPKVNSIHWSLKAEHKDVFDFYRGLISLRKAHPAFRMSSKDEVDRALEFLPDMPTNVVAYVLQNHANGDAWKDILVIYNGNLHGVKVAVAGDWQIVANNAAAGTNTIESVSNEIRVEPCSLVIARGQGVNRE